MRAFRGFILHSVLVASTVTMLLAQTDQRTTALEIDGRPGRAEVIQKDGRVYVDLRSLVEMTGATMSLKGSLVVLTLPLANSQSHASEVPDTSPSGSSDEHALSRDFTRAGIEAIATMREWASTLAYAIENNYQVTDDWIAKYREEAQHAVRLASTASSTDADRKALQLLTNEFETVRLWSDKLVQAKRSMDTAKYAMSVGALRNEPSSQKIITCGHFLASMFGSGSYKDDPSCQ
jgi:hypothetical protein